MSLLSKFRSSMKCAEAAERSLENQFDDFKEKELLLQQEQEVANLAIERTLTISNDKMHRQFNI